jgi:N-acyl-D-aspartate/D-glutamate deacylase
VCHAPNKANEGTPVDFDLIIAGGTIVDGTRFPRFRGDLGVVGGRIAEVGDLSQATAERRLEATGSIVAPGHIDSHTHYDAQIFWDPTCSNAGENGITTVVAGNCGFGFAPCRVADRDRYMRMMETTEQIPHSQLKAALPWSWESLPELIDALKATPKAVNIMMYLPLNALMFYVMGEAAKTRRATRDEMERMKALLHEAMDAGACGLSLSYMGAVNNHVDVDGSPMPTDVMEPEDIYELATVLRDRREGIIQVISQIGPVGDRSISEGLARVSGRPILHNVFSVSEFTPDLHQKSLRWIDEQLAEGAEMFATSIVTRAWNEVDLLQSPGCALDALDVYRELTFCPSAAEKRAKLLDPDFRARFKAAYDPVMFEATAGSIEAYSVISLGEGAEDKQGYVGRTLGEIAKQQNKDVIDAFIDLYLETDLKAELKTPGIAADPIKVAQLLQHPNVLAGASDGGAHTKNFSGGQWATDLIIWLAHENPLMTLEELHYRLAYQPARVMGLKGRGALIEGMAADVLIYRPEELFFDQSRFEVVHDAPGGGFRRRARAGGYRNILVNGVETFSGAYVTGAAPGEFLEPARPLRTRGSRVAEREAQRIG